MFFLVLKLLWLFLVILLFIFLLIQATLPWAECPALVHELASNLTVGATDSTLLSECDRSSETQYFWYRETLDITSSISDPDGIRWWMFLCLLASWIMIYLIIMKGIESSGNVVYFTALFPYIVMTIFFIRGITLKGAGAGLAHMFYPKVLRNWVHMILSALNLTYYFAKTIFRLLQIKFIFRWRNC